MRLLLIALLLLMPFFGNGQTLEIREGHAYWLVNAPGLSFHLRVDGDKLQAAEQEVFLLVDDQIIQLTVFHRDVFKGGTTPQALLKAYYDYECNYLRGMLGKRTRFKGSKHRLNSGHEALFWHFEMPVLPDADAEVEERSVEQQLLNIACKDYMIGLSAPRMSNVTHAALRDRLFRVANTLVIHETPITQETLETLD